MLTDVFFCVIITTVDFNRGERNESGFKEGLGLFGEGSYQRGELFFADNSRQEVLPLPNVHPDYSNCFFGIWVLQLGRIWGFLGSGFLGGNNSHRLFLVVGIPQGCGLGRLYLPENSRASISPFLSKAEAC